MYAVKGQNRRNQSHGFCIITMCNRIQHFPYVDNRHLKIYQGYHIPSYSPDLVPGDLFLFPKLISTFKSHIFEEVNETIYNATEDLKAIFLKKIKRYFKSLILLVVENTVLSCRFTIVVRSVHFSQ